MTIITAGSTQPPNDGSVFRVNGSIVTLKKISETEWILFGDLADGDSEGFGGGDLPSEIGQEFGGGFYIGDITIADGGEDDGEYSVIMGGLESEATLAWKDPRSSTPGTDSNTNSMANTLAMQANDPAIHYAGMHCLNYRGGGFDDWCMPARHVLNLAWDNRASLGAMAMGAQYYWSSTQHLADSAWFRYFSNGNEGSDRKTFSYRVRPVRMIKMY